MRKFVLVFCLTAALGTSLWGQTNRVRLVEGESYVHRPSNADDKRLVQIRDRGRAYLDDAEFEVEFKVDIRGSMESLLGALFEKSKIAGLRGICEIFVDGMPKGSIKMSSGRMDISILGGLIDSALDAAFSGTPDMPDKDFTQSDPNAEWSRIIDYDGMRYKILIRFVYRESSNRMRYYVFVEKAGLP